MAKSHTKQHRSRASRLAPSPGQPRVNVEVPPPASTPRAAHGNAFPVVGIGAAAGGLEAFTQLLKHLPPDTGMGFVLVQHLDPTHESKLAELLARATRMPVVEARNGMRVAPDHVYVIPPNRGLVMDIGRLKLTPRGRGRILPVNTFLKSLADERGHQAIGVILSGTATDGAEGLEAIKAAGGITFAQDEKSAKHDGMPEPAIATGCVDFVLPPELIARELAEISRHPYVKPTTAANAAADAGDGLNRILRLLLRASGVDFTHYRPGTLQRRIQRRMALHRIHKLDRYAEFLKTHAGEAEKLYEDLLIAVTGLQSANEELTTVNEQLQPRNVEMGELNAAVNRSLTETKAARDYAEALIATTRHPMALLNAALRVRTVNGAFLRTFQLTREQTVGRLIYDLGNRQWDIASLRRLLENILPANSRFDDYRVEHTFPKIGRRTVLVNARRLAQAVGQPPLILLAIEDVTEQQRARDELERQEQLYRLLFELNPNPMWVFDELTLRFLAVNEAAVKLCGWSREEFLRMTIKDVRPPAEVPKLEQKLARQRGSRATFVGEWRHWKKDRTLLDAEVTISCIQFQNRDARLMMVNAITGRKRAEEQLKELNATLEHRVAERTEKLLNANERLRAIMDNALVGILTLDEHGKIESLSPAAAGLFGYSPDEVVGRNVSRFMASPLQMQGEKFLEQYTRPGDQPFRAVPSEVLGRRKDGQIMMLELTLSDFTHKGRREFVAMVRNITPRKRLERELLDIAERERQRIGHDLHDGLGQQLHGLSYLAVLLEKRLEEDASARLSEAAQLNKHLQEALDLTRSLAHGLQPVKSLPEGLMTALRELAERTRGLYRIDCRFDCRAPVLIYRHSAANHLYRIAQEAVNNATKHGKPTRVRIKLAATRQRIILGVRDNGVGIRPQIKPGRGMGLHVMQYRADAISGSLIVQRHPHGGTEVVCTVKRQALLPQEDNFK